MKYANIIKGTFIRRLNRFIAEVIVKGEIEQVHVKNTGRCREILVEGTEVFLEESSNIQRKTRYSLISAYKGDLLINIDSQVPNIVVYNGMVGNGIEGFYDLAEVKREKTYGNSRFDIYYERENGIKGFIEVKGVTLEVDGLAMFPDAPTKRGSKHLQELVYAVEEGYEGNVLFLIQMEGIFRFSPNIKMDPIFAGTLKKAYEAGVRVIVYNSIVKEDSITINDKGMFIK